MAGEDVAAAGECDEEVVDRARLRPHQRQEQRANGETEQEIASIGRGHG
jgi:hypothetical protein